MKVIKIATVILIIGSFLYYRDSTIIRKNQHDECINDVFNSFDAK